MTTLYKYINLLFIITFCQSGWSQTIDSTRAEYLFPFSGAYQQVSGDFSSRFGNFLDAGTGIEYKNTLGITYGIKFNYLFEAPIKSASAFESLANQYNLFIGTEGTPVEPRVKGRGFKLYGEVGKIFPLNDKNKNSGLWIKGGLGYMQHKIRFSGELDGFPLLQDPYVQGYDKLSGGMMYSGFIGYLYMPPLIQKNISDVPTYFDIYGIFIGLEFTQANIRSMRSFHFDTQSSDNNEYRDRLWGIKFGWIFTLNNEKKEGDHYY